ncbi:MAG: hypothetical protein C4534_04780 [Gaiellales bacterium]|nr:MAG: hypothetical protein C4534_04780 [Gaiellales bacterium]
MSLKVNFLAQINPLKASGGGEMVNRELILAGESMGHEVRVSAAWPEQEHNFFPEADIYLLSDIYNQPSARHRLPSDLVERVIKEEPYIHLDNAYVDICDLPYLLCNGDTDGERCPYKRSLDVQKHRMFRRRGCFSSLSRSIYTNSLLNVFLSPLHRQTVQRVIGVETLGDYFEMRPTVDTSVFFDEGRTRDIENLFVGPLNEAKGLENMRRCYPDGNIVFVGPDSLREDDAFGYRVGRVDYRDMPVYMNRAINFVFLPRWPEPMGRVVIEAALCGCNLVTNANVGATSFDFDISDPGNLEGAAAEFWRKIEECAHGRDDS